MEVEVVLPNQSPVRVWLPQSGVLTVGGVQLRTGASIHEVPPCPACAARRQHTAEEFSNHPVSTTIDIRH